MNNMMILGRFIPGKSLIHRMDPRAKLILAFYLIAIIFLANSWASYGFLLVLTLIGVRLSNLSLSFFLKGLRPLLWLILFTVLLQIFFTTGGQVYWHWGWLTLSRLGIINGAYIFMRFVLIIFISTLLTLTTSSLALADAIESILRPLKKIHFPVDEVALMLSIALRFVPTLMDETTKIMNAQRARGVDFGTGSLLQQIKAIVPLLIPLFVSSFNRADDLATAMESRGYQGGEGRTKYRVLTWQRRDTWSIVVVAGITLVLVIFRIFQI